MARTFRHLALMLLIAVVMLPGCRGSGTGRTPDENAAVGNIGDATAPAGPAAPTAIEPALIVLSHPYIGAAAEAIAGAVAMFDESRPDISVRIQPTSIEDILFAIPQKIRAGKGPDVFIAPDTFARQWATLDNILQPLDTLVKTPEPVTGITSGSGTEPGNKTTSSTGAKPVTVVEPDGNRALAVELANRLSADSRTYGLALAIRVPLLVANDDFLGTDFRFTSGQGSKPTAVSVVANDWLALTGFASTGQGRIIDGTGRPAFDDPPAAAGIIALAALLESGAIRPERSREATIAAFNNLEIVAMITWPDTISLISPSISWRVIPFPEIDGVGRPMPWWQVDSVFISSWSRNRRPAADLAAWLTSPAAADFLMRHDFQGLIGQTEEYAALPVNRGIRTQRAASIPSPDLRATATAASYFARLVTELADLPTSATATAPGAIKAAAIEARDAVTKVMQSSSFRLK